MATAEKILVRGVNWLGDAVMTTPALQRLRQARPAAHITLLTPVKLADLWPGHPSLDAIVTFDEGDSVLSLARRLRREKFDVAVVLPNSPRSALEMFLARIPQRIGLARGGRSLLLSQALPPRAGAVRMHKRSIDEVRQRLAAGGGRDSFPPAAHHVHDYLHIVAALGADPTPLPPLLHVDPTTVSAAVARLAPGATGPLIGINPGAEYGPAKRWPAERFIEAATQLHAHAPAHWLIFGGRGDQALTARIAVELSARLGAGAVTDVAGRTSLRDLCALLQGCAVLLTNDTGPMHVAAAVGTPVVVPFGSTAPELTGPSFTTGSPHRLLLGEAACAPCFLRECPADFRCLTTVTVEKVVQAARETLSRRRP